MINSLLFCQWHLFLDHDLVECLNNDKVIFRWNQVGLFFFLKKYFYDQLIHIPSWTINFNIKKKHISDRLFLNIKDYSE